MPLEKTSTVSVRTIDGGTVFVARRDGAVEFAHHEGGTMTFSAEDLREIVREFAKAPRQPRGPRKVSVTHQNGQAAESRVAA